MRVCVYHGILRYCDPYFMKYHLNKFPCLICKFRGSQMASTISYPIQPSDKYPKATMKIQSWLCEKNEIANRHRTQISIEAETEKAYLIKFITGVPEEHWIPKSVCEIVQRTGARLISV